VSPLLGGVEDAVQTEVFAEREARDLGSISLTSLSGWNTLGPPERIDVDVDDSELVSSCRLSQLWDFHGDT